jgi:hypothetical protein
MDCFLMAVSRKPLFEMRGTYHVQNMVHEIDPEKVVATSTLEKYPCPVKCSFEDAPLGFSTFNVFPLIDCWQFQKSPVLLVS